MEHLFQNAFFEATFLTRIPYKIYEADSLHITSLYRPSQNFPSLSHPHRARVHTPLHIQLSIASALLSGPGIRYDFRSKYHFHVYLLSSIPGIYLPFHSVQFPQTSPVGIHRTYTWSYREVTRLGIDIHEDPETGVGVWRTLTICQTPDMLAYSVSYNESYAAVSLHFALSTVLFYVLNITTNSRKSIHDYDRIR